MFDLNEVLVFAKVVETGSFVAAAAALGMPKTTVSHRIRSLEGRLGATLLQRTTRQMSLTESGQAFYEHCERVLVELQDAEAAVGQIQSAPHGLLRIAAPTVFAQFLMSPLLPEFMREYRTLRIRLTVDNTQRTPVASGHDLAFRVGPQEDNELVSRTLCLATLRLYAAATYLESHGEPQAPEDLAKHTLLVNNGGALETTWKLNRGSVERQIRPQGLIVSNDMVVLRAALCAGLGVTLLPEFVCRDDVARGAVREVLPHWSAPRVELRAVYPSRRFIAPKVRVALDFFAAQVPRLVG